MPELNAQQFPDNYPAVKPLKSKWIPEQTDRKSLGWHIIDRHLRQKESPDSTPEMPIWTHTEGPARNGMSDADYHAHLHEVGHFNKDSEHDHFTPKKGGRR
jgi:hypothetical protein